MARSRHVCAADLCASLSGSGLPLVVPPFAIAPSFSFPACIRSTQSYGASLDVKCGSSYAPVKEYSSANLLG